MINFKNLCIAIAFAIITPLQVNADKLTDVINDVAARLVQQLPLDTKIALKSLSPDETGLPEDFLRKLTSDLEAALLTASGFEINLANRVTIDEVWQEAVEFNNANFDELFKSANADIMLMLSPRAISTGVEVAITAYSLTGNNVGKVLASSGSVLLPIDLQANLGVDVNDLNKQMAQVLAEIEKVGQTGGLIVNPNTYAEYYNNARILQQRGEIDLAIGNYEAALMASPFPFVDPVEDLVALAQFKYGINSSAYISKRLKEILTDDLYAYALWLSDPKSTQISTLQLAENGQIFLPLVVVWLEQNKKALEERIRVAELEGTPDYEALFQLLEGSRTYLEALNTGELQSYYIDKLRARASMSQSELRNMINEFSFVSYSIFETDYQYGSGTKSLVPLCDDDNCEFPSSAQGIPSLEMPAPGIPQVAMLDAGNVIELPKRTMARNELLEAFPKINQTITENFLNDLQSHAVFQGENNVYLEELQQHMGPCGSVISSDKTPNIKIDVPDVQKSKIKLRQGFGTFASELVVAAYEPLIYADTCVDLWKSSSKPASNNQANKTRDLVPTNTEFTKSTGLLLHPNSDRINQLSITNNWRSYSNLVINDFVENSPEMYKLSGLQGLLITDNVDTSKPVLLAYGINEYIGANSWNIQIGLIDVSKDGSLLDQNGMPMNPKFRTNWKMDGQNAEISSVRNNWLYIPGVVQGSLGLNKPYILGAIYNDLAGNRNVIKNSNFTIPIGDYIPDAPAGFLLSDACQEDTDPKTYQEDGCVEQRNSLTSNSVISRETTWCPALNCVEDFSLPRLASFSFLRSVHFHNSNKQAQTKRTDPTWVKLNSIPGPIHLGDERINAWPSLHGRCYAVSFPAQLSDAKIAITFEPYGIEKANIYDGMGYSYNLSPQKVVSGKRPNYWGDRQEIILQSGATVTDTEVLICSEKIDGTDYDDLMIRNVTSWIFR